MLYYEHYTMPQQTINNASTERGYRKQVLLALAGTVLLLIAFKVAGTGTSSSGTNDSKAQTATFNMKAHSLTDPDSI